MNKKNLTEAQMQELLLRMKKNYTYDAKSGKLVNKRTGRLVKGSKCSYKNGEYRYLYMGFYINGQRHKVLMHVAVWVWHNGCFPTKLLDHINGNGFDNHIQNLREVSQSENIMNTLYPWKPNAKTGLPGVHKNGSGYQIEVGQNYYRFRDKHEAFCHLTLLGRRYKGNESNRRSRFDLQVKEMKE